MMGRVQRSTAPERRKLELQVARPRAQAKLVPSVLLRVQLVLSNLAWLIVCLIGAAVVVLLFLLHHR